MGAPPEAKIGAHNSTFVVWVIFVKADAIMAPLAVELATTVTYGGLRVRNGGVPVINREF